MNRYSAANARAFAGSTVSQEDLEKEREASQKRKAAEANELAALLEDPWKKLTFCRKKKQRNYNEILGEKDSTRDINLKYHWIIVFEMRFSDVGRCNMFLQVDAGSFTYLEISIKQKNIHPKNPWLLCFQPKTWPRKPQEQKADVKPTIGSQKLAFQAKVEKKVEKKMPLLSVKKPKTTDAEATTEVAKKTDEKVEATEMEQKDDTKEMKTDGTGGLGIGLAYSDSEEES